VEGGTCVFGGDVKVRGSIGRDDERETFCVELDGACDEVGIAGGDVVGMSYAGDAPLFFQSEESPRDRRKGDAESFGEGGRIQGGSLFALEEVKNTIGQLAGSRHGFQGIIVPRIDEYTIRCY
jgi:hypothetical protein